MLIDMIAMHVMKMSVMQIVHVIAVVDCGMAALGAMQVRMRLLVFGMCCHDSPRNVVP
jgi:hypothetical protein